MCLSILFSLQSFATRRALADAVSLGRWTVVRAFGHSSTAVDGASRTTLTATTTTTTTTTTTITTTTTTTATTTTLRLLSLLLIVILL